MLVLSCGNWQPSISGLVMLLSCHLTQALTFLSASAVRTHSKKHQCLLHQGWVIGALLSQEGPSPGPLLVKSTKTHMRERQPWVRQCLLLPVITASNYLVCGCFFFNWVESGEKWLQTEDIVSDSQFIKQISKMGISIICGGADNGSTLDVSSIWTSIKSRSVQKQSVSSAKSFTFLAPLQRNNRKEVTSCRYRKPTWSWQKDFIGLEPKSLDINTLLI